MKFGLPSAPQRWSALCVLALLLNACVATTPVDAPPVAESASPAPVAIPEQVAQLPSIETLTAQLPRLDGPATVEITTGNRTITVELDGTKAPYTAGNFVDLAQKGIYDGTIFHRVVNSPDPFVAQGGDPQSKDPNFPNNLLGTGGYEDPETGRERMIPLEILPEGASEPIYGQTLPDAQVSAPPVLNHRRGAIAMARSDVNTASSQFYITLADLPFLDGNYAVFGYVTDGMNVVDNIQRNDIIASIEVTAGAENLVLPESATDAESAE